MMIAVLWFGLPVSGVRENHSTDQCSFSSVGGRLCHCVWLLHILHYSVVLKSCLEYQRKWPSHLGRCGFWRNVTMRMSLGVSYCNDHLIHKTSSYSLGSGGVFLVLTCSASAMCLEGMALIPEQIVWGLNDFMVPQIMCVSDWVGSILGGTTLSLPSHHPLPSPHHLSPLLSSSVLPIALTSTQQPRLCVA